MTSRFTFRDSGAFGVNNDDAGSSGECLISKGNAPPEYQPVGARAWIHLDGSGTVTERKSYNVSGVSDLGVGNYRINWDDDFSDAYYVVCFGQSQQPNNGSTHGGLKVTAQLTSRIDVINCRDENGADVVDKDMVSVATFSD
jgi:hypothetical protein